MQLLEKAINNSKFKKAYKIEHLKYENNFNNFPSGIRLYILLREKYNYTISTRYQLKKST